MNFRLFNRENSANKDLTLSLPTISCDFSENTWSGINLYKAAHAHEIGVAMFNRIADQAKEITMLKQQLSEQDKIITSLKAELGTYLRGKEDAKQADILPE